jgi:TolB-like protein
VRDHEAVAEANRTGPIASNAPPPLAAQRLSIVVLPFANLSGDPAQDYLADALTDQLTTGISRAEEIPDAPRDQDERNDPRA